MAAIERRLSRLIDLENRHCGRDELVEQANRARQRLIEYCEAEIEKLAEKAGCP